MKAEILALLRERADYVSGQELCERFGVSRTAVWKAIGRLKEEGYRIEAVPNKGYRLLETEEVYGQNEIASRMNTKWVGKPVLFFDCIGSTNAQAKIDAENGAGSGTLLVADMQTAGRGRRGRSWTSPAGTNIYYTLILKPKFDPDKASMLTLVMAMAVSEGIEKYLADNGCKDVTCGIKWPNDVVLSGRKCVGILCEGAFDPEGRLCVIMGVGFNGNQRVFPPELAASATSLFLEKQRQNPDAEPVILRELLTAFLEAAEKAADRLEEGGLPAILPEYRARSVTIGSAVRVIAPTEEYIGQAEGMDASGSLLVRDGSGVLRTVVCGDVSVRGLMGYAEGT